jgi:biopolymer transport protein ExbD
MGGMLAKDAAGADGPIAGINVTSLVDVMFCLLIMFMVATPLMSKEDMKLEIPNAKGREITEEEFLYSVISIDATGQVFLGVLPLSKDPEQMRREIAGNDKLKEDGMAFIQGDQNVHYEKIVDVIVALKEAGVEQVGFVTNPKIKKAKKAN